MLFDPLEKSQVRGKIFALRNVVARLYHLPLTCLVRGKNSLRRNVFKDYETCRWRGIEKDMHNTLGITSNNYTTVWVDLTNWDMFDIRV